MAAMSGGDAARRRQSDLDLLLVVGQQLADVFHQVAEARGHSAGAEHQHALPVVESALPLERRGLIARGSAAARDRGTHSPRTFRSVNRLISASSALSSSLSRDPRSRRRFIFILASMTEPE